MNSMFNFALAPYELLSIFVVLFLGVALLMYFGFRPKILGFGKLRLEAKDEMQQDQSLLYNINRGIRNIDTFTRKAIRNNSGIEVRQIVREIATGCSASRLAIELVLNAAVKAVASDNHFTSSLQTDAGRNDMIIP
jgi:predicted aldo/keto reductase-like oxidoreductase